MAAVSDRPVQFLRQAPAASLPPPASRAGVFGWLRANLFSSPFNIALTLIAILFIAWIVPPLLRFLLIDATWSGSDREACIASPANPNPGACWAFIRVWSSYFVYGFYPSGERWRVDLFFAALAFGIGWLAWLSAPRRDIGAVYFFIVLPMNTILARMRRGEVAPDPTTKKCPECLSDVPIAARRCAFCTSLLTEAAAR